MRITIMETESESEFVMAEKEVEQRDW